jgi:hypothetical protein
VAKKPKPYVFRKTTGYWFGQGDHKYTLSSDLPAWWEYPQPRRLPPLSAEEVATVKKAMEENRRMGELLDRAAALERWGPPKPPAKKKKKSKKPKGAPREVDLAAIRAEAEAFIRESGRPRSNRLLAEKTRDRCKAKRIIAPRERWLQKITAPVFKNQKKPKTK